MIKSGCLFNGIKILKMIQSKIGQTKKKNEKDREETFGRARASHCVMAGFKSVHTQSVMFHDAPWPLWLNLKNKKSEHEQLSQFYLKKLLTSSV